LTPPQEKNSAAVLDPAQLQRHAILIANVLQYACTHLIHKFSPCLPKPLSHASSQSNYCSGVFLKRNTSRCCSDSLQVVRPLNCQPGTQQQRLRHTTAHRPASHPNTAAASKGGNQPSALASLISRNPHSCCLPQVLPPQKHTPTPLPKCCTGTAATLAAGAAIPMSAVTLTTMTCPHNNTHMPPS
jgi:hypothetical protein